MGADRIRLRQKSETRNPKAEIRNPKKSRADPGASRLRDLNPPGESSLGESVPVAMTRQIPSAFGIRISFGPRVSAFGIASPPAPLHPSGRTIAVTKASGLRYFLATVLT